MAAISIAIAAALIIIAAVSFTLGGNNEQEFRDLCKTLDSTFIEANSRWLCVRDGEVVYPQ